MGADAGTQQRSSGFGAAVTQLASESAVHGVVLISGLLVIVAVRPDSVERGVLVKVLATVLVFWLAHVYAGAVVHLGDHLEDGASARVRLWRAVRYSVNHSWGMLGAALLPAVLLGLGAAGLLAWEIAIWGTLWADVAILGLIGYVVVARWTPRFSSRLVGAASTALLGIVLIVLKALIH